MNGVLNVYKEKGYTSHDVVAKLRGILHMKKIGHTGTLDPDAQGVLPVCLGSATKLCDVLTDKSKTYEAVLLLGVDTDTQDCSGKILKKSEVFCSEEEVKQTIAAFIGVYHQVPPMYSALKVNGRKLYELAREGKEVERKAREVEIFQIDILEMNLPRVRMAVSCSKGTYIRTLCHDIGEKLGCGGCMEHLLRTRVGGFSIEQAHTLAQIEQLRDSGTLEQYVTAVWDLFPEYDRCCVKSEFTRLSSNGNPLRPNQLTQPPVSLQNPVLIFEERADGSSLFVGIYRWREEKQMLYPEKLFLTAAHGVS